MTMTRTRAGSSSLANITSRSLRGVTRKQSEKCITQQKMIKKPRKRAKSLPETCTKKALTAVQVHELCRPGCGFADDRAVISSTRIHVDETDEETESLGDEELPAIQFDSSNATTKVKELVPGTMVWAKSRGWPHWPAVLLKVFSNNKKAWVNYLDENNQSIQVSLRSMAPFFGPSRSQYIEIGKSCKWSREFTMALERAEDYLIKQGLGKSADSTCNMSYTLSDLNRCASPLTLSPSRIALSQETLPSTSHETKLPPALPTVRIQQALESSNNMMSSEDELRIGYPICRSSPDTTNGENQELIERRKAWKHTENRLLKYIRRDTTKNHLLAIYHGKIKSERQALFESMRTRDRQKLRLKAGLGPITDDDLQCELTNYLRDLYVEHCMECKEDIPNTSYITEVWLPEAIIFAIQKTRHVGRSTAEKLFHSEGAQSLVDLGEDMPVVTPRAIEALDES